MMLWRTFEETTDMTDRSVLCSHLGKAILYINASVYLSNKYSTGFYETIILNILYCKKADQKNVLVECLGVICVSNQFNLEFLAVASDYKGYPHNIFLIHPKNMLWVLIRNASPRSF